MTKRHSSTIYAVVSIFVIITVGSVLYYHSTSDRSPFLPSLSRSPCWFSTAFFDHRVECFYVNVPENYHKENQSPIHFPVAVFRSNTSSSLPPVLHLGAGGPGAPMYLDDDYNMQTFYETYVDIVLNQGRDFYVIDPRGTGLSKPLLVCEEFVKNIQNRLKENLNYKDEWTAADNDYLHCINQFKKQGIDLAQYNSIAITNDIYTMKNLFNEDRWILLGVSYGAVYAQIFTQRHPESVEAMILDSAAFPNLKYDNNFLERTRAPYVSLYNYCDSTASCETPIENIEERLWKIYETLNRQPLTFNEVIVNGDRFMAALIEGTYGESIYKDFPEIIQEAESGQINKLQPYLENYLSFLLDSQYGDVSATAHYCFEDKPFVDISSLKKIALDIPEAPLRTNVLDSLNWPDLCAVMNVAGGDSILAEPLHTSIPTLFLHGVFDTITPLDDVEKLRLNFENSLLFSFELSHGILGSNTCAKDITATFVAEPGVRPIEPGCF